MIVRQYILEIQTDSSEEWVEDEEDTSIQDAVQAAEDAANAVLDEGLKAKIREPFRHE